MSDRSVLCVLALCLGGPLPLLGQSRAELEARLAALRAQQAELDSAVARRQRLEAAARGWRITRAGKLALHHEGAEGALASRVVAAAWDELAGRFGGMVEAGDTLHIRMTRVRSSPRGEPLAPEARPIELAGMGRTRPGTPVTTRFLPAPVQPGDVVTALVQTAAERRWARVDAALTRWYPAPPVDSMTVRQRRRTYIQLAASPFEGGSLCFAADLASCRRTLGLVPRPMDPVASYQPQERREFVRRLGRTSLPAALVQLRADCVEERVFAACDTVLAQTVSPWPMIPLDQDARGMLLMVALEGQGAAGLERLVADSTAPLAERLAAAAQRPVDSVVAQWRREVMGSRPVPDRSRGRGWASFAWSIVLMGLALRSSRWR